MKEQSGMTSRSSGTEDGQSKLADSCSISLKQRRRVQMKTTALVSHLGTRLMWAGVLVAAFLMAGCISVDIEAGTQPQCASGSGDDGSTVGTPINCIPVDVTPLDGPACTSGQRCSDGTVNKSCPFSTSRTKCRTLPHPDGTLGKCYCTCTT